MGQVYVGVDIHKNYSWVCAMDEKGKIFYERKVPSEEIEDTIEEIPGNKVVILEPTTVTMPIAIKLRKTTEVKLAHPLKTKLIAESKKKTDKVDAKVLADLARTNFLPEAYLPPDEIIELREIIRERVRLKRLSVSIKNRIYSILTKNGIKIERPFTKGGGEELRSLENVWINRYLKILERIEEEIKEIDKEIKRICLMNEEISILLTIPGIGYFSALLIYAEVGDINRFPNSKKLCRFGSYS